jgi:RNA polymerase sigma-70 factor (ECF subfamily)
MENQLFKISEKEHFDEEEIIRKAQKNISQFEQLYDKHYLKVFWFVYNRIENHTDASEITSDIFLKAMENIQRYVCKGLPFINWLLVIARNEVNMHYRKEKKERKYFVHTDRINEVKDELEEEEKTIIPYDKLIAIIESLHEKDYELFHLKYFDKKTFQEIAEITQTKEVSLRVRYHRIKKELRELILNENLFKTAAMLATICILYI